LVLMLAVAPIAARAASVPSGDSLVVSYTGQVSVGSMAGRLGTGASRRRWAIRARCPIRLQYAGESRIEPGESLGRIWSLVGANRLLGVR